MRKFPAAPSYGRTLVEDQSVKIDGADYFLRKGYLFFLLIIIKIWAAFQDQSFLSLFTIYIEIQRTGQIRIISNLRLGLIA